MSSYQSPLGIIWIASDPTGIIRLQMPCTRGKERFLEALNHRYGLPKGSFTPGGPVNSRLVLELEAYFSGKKKNFSIPVHLNGTAFQKRVWKRVSQIPFGKTRSYGQIAADLNIPKGGRAVGQANRINPVPLIIPCHRVIASDGTLGGYSPGIKQKRWLLKWETQNQNARS